MGIRRDSQAEIFYLQGQRFFDHVVRPTLENLKPIPPEKIGGPRKFLIQIARDNSHNALCYEARLSFALIMGATFERQLRFWLIQAAPQSHQIIEKSNFSNLAKITQDIANIHLQTLPETADLLELWNVVNAARHGDGSSAIKLAEARPQFWSHVGDFLRERYFKAGLRVYSMRISDEDLVRYNRAVLGFWKAAIFSKRKRR